MLMCGLLFLSEVLCFFSLGFFCQALLRKVVIKESELSIAQYTQSVLKYLLDLLQLNAIKQLARMQLAFSIVNETLFCHTNGGIFVVQIIQDASLGGQQVLQATKMGLTMFLHGPVKGYLLHVLKTGLSNSRSQPRDSERLNGFNRQVFSFFRRKGPIYPQPFLCHLIFKCAELG